MAVKLHGRDLLSMKDLSSAELLALLDLADEIKAHRAKYQRAAPLAGQTLAMIFQKPSLRTRVSFETGMTRLGGHAIYLSPVDFKLGERESVEDVALVLSRMADIIMARVFGHDLVAGLARHASVPVINGLSDFEHPCQILADLQTIRERKGGFKGLTAAWIGDGNNVAHSLMYGAALVGMSLKVTTPAEYAPSATVLAESQEIGRKTGATIRVVHDLAEGAKDADVLYTDVWASMGQEAEAELRKQKFAGYQINAKLMSHAKPDAIILHCLPAHYGDEIDYATSRTPNSAIFDQAENRLHAQNALLVMIAGGARAAGKAGAPGRSTEPERKRGAIRTPARTATPARKRVKNARRR